MNREELQNYTQEEKELAEAALNKCVSLGFFDPRFFFEDKVHFKETYSVRIDMKIPVKLLLPFYEQMLIPIRPFKSPVEFEKRCGITVEELEILFRENRVIPLPIGHLYLYDGLDYLMPILEEKPPTMLRMDYAERFFWGDKSRARRFAIEANAELAGRFKDLGKKYEKISYFKELPKSPEEQLETESIERYKSLSYFGYNWLAKAVSGMEDIASVYYQLGLCNAFLVSPFLAGGFPQYSELALDVFRGQAFLVKGKKVKLFEKSLKEIKPFPMEIGRVLLTKEEERLKLIFPSGITLADVLRIAGDSAFQKAREALREFDIAVKNKLSEEEVLSRKAAIDAIWDDTRETIESIKLDAKGVKWFLWGLSMGVLGSLAISLTGFPGLLSLFGIGVALDKIIEPEPLIVRAKLDSLPLAIYKLEKVFEKTNE